MDGQHGIKSKKRFSSLFGRFSRSKTLDSTSTRSGKGAASTMILKLKSPGTAGDEVADDSNEQFLTNILANEQLFDMLHGRSLVLQAELTVEKRKEDGSPKTMTISGLVPVTLTRGERNGKPTRELRVRGQLRRKRSRDMRLPYDDLEQKRTGFGAGGRRKEILLDWTPKRPEESMLLQARNSKLFERYRTISAVSTKSKKESMWPQADVEGGNSGDEDPEPSRIENWSPLFDFSSPMSGPTGRDRVRALSDWKTPTPRFDLDLRKDASADDRSKDKMQEIKKDEKTLKCNQLFQFNKDELDKCLHSKTRETGSQTSNSNKDQYVARGHTSTQTDALPKDRELSSSVISRSAKKTNLLLPEEIKQKSSSLNESKQIISSVQDNAADTFAEVHEKIQNAIHDTDCGRHGEVENTSSPSHEKCQHNGKVNRKDPPKSIHQGESHIREMKRNHHKGQNHETERLNGQQVQQERIHPCHDKQQHKQRSGSNILHVSSQPDDEARNCTNESFVRKATTQPERKEPTILTKTHDQLNDSQDEKHDIQNLHYSTDKGYFYGPPAGLLSGKDKGLKTPDDTYEDFKKRLNTSRHGTTNHIINSRNPDRLQSTFHEGEASNSAKPKNGTTDGHGELQNGKSSKLICENSKSRTLTPNMKIQNGPNESCEQNDSAHRKLDTKTLNPIATITISRSHTRFYNYSDGYTYTEKDGRQTVIIEAPKGMYYAS